MEGPHPDMDEGLSSLCFGSAGGVRAASNAGLARLNTLFALDESRFLCCLRFFLARLAKKLCLYILFFSCPQAPSMSLPRELRIVASFPELFKDLTQCCWVAGVLGL